MHRLEQWRERGIISSEQYVLLAGLARNEPLSVFLELNLLLYGGVLAFIAGLGWTVTTWSQNLGDFVILTVLTALLGACLWYCFSRAGAWSPSETPSPNLIFDYVLYLASLVWSVELAYVENRFRILDGQWDLYLLVSAGLFYFLAYRFDNRLVLSLALSSLAGWSGLTISHWPSYGDDQYRQSAILYSLIVAGAGVLLQRRGIKAHFFGTYLNITATVLFWALLSGVFEYESSVVWLLCLLAACGAALWWGITRRQFSFVAYAAVYGYIGVSSLLIRGMNGAGIMFYFVISGGVMFVVLVYIAKRFGEGVMRAYSAASEEALHIRSLLKDWIGEGLLTDEQYRTVEPEVSCDLRRTNIFLRLVLFLFTSLIVGAAVAVLFIALEPASRGSAIILLCSAVVCYAAAEVAVAHDRLYRYGIEEAFAVCAIGLLCAGIATAIPSPDAPGFLVPAVGIAASLWIWRRFGLPYAPAAAMLFAIWLPTHWTTSSTEQRVAIATLYTFGLCAVAWLRRGQRFTFLDTEYSVAEALLWFGIYGAINLKLEIPNLLGIFWSVQTPEFPRAFYWTTWVLSWCLPVVILARGLRERDRFVMAVGLVTAIVTLITNKPYLGWERHTWDPMLLGAFLVGVAICIRRWLAEGPGEVRRGFTAQRLSGKDKRWMTAGTTALGFVSPATIAPHPSGPDAHFGGGDSGGGGASGDF